MVKILVIGDPHGKLPKNLEKDLKGQRIDYIFLTGDIGKVDLARERFFENINRKKKGLEELPLDKKFEKAVHMEVYNSTMRLLKRLIKVAPVYTILGNVADTPDYLARRENEQKGLKLPLIRKGMNSIKGVNIVRNQIRNLGGLRIGFLEYFLDDCWVKEFKPSDYKDALKNAIKETGKSKKILKWFDKVDILVCHQPPYGILDKVTWKAVPKHWLGKHAGSKIILDYIKKKKPRWVFCGHIHEGKGKKKIGKTEIYNMGCEGNYSIIVID